MAAPTEPSSPTANAPRDEHLELGRIVAAWPTIADEARALVAGAVRKAGGRHALPDSLMLPLFGPDATGEPPAATTALVRGTPSVTAAAFSVLASRKSITRRGQASPHETAMLCLQSGAASFVIVDGQRHDLRDGELLVLRPGQVVESVNHGTDDRIVLLLALDPRPEAMAKSLALWILRDVVERGCFAVADAACAPHLAERVKTFAAELRAPFPDLTLAEEFLIAEGNRVVCGWTARGTHAAPYKNIPATGAVVTFGGTLMLELALGRVVGMHLVTDALSLLQQLRTALRR